MKSLIVYYSLEGNTKLIADNLAKITDADLLPLKVVNDLPKNSPMRYVNGGRDVLMKHAPALKTEIPDLSSYDFIVIGTPVWAGSFAPAIRSFAKKANLMGKKIAFFTCSTSGKNQKCIGDLKDLFFGNTFVGDIGFVDPAKNHTTNSILRSEAWVNTLRQAVFKSSREEIMESLKQREKTAYLEEILPVKVKPIRFRVKEHEESRNSGISSKLGILKALR